MRTISVLMANKPRMLRDMLWRVFEREDYIQVEGAIDNVKVLPLIAEKLKPDWIVLNLNKNRTFPAMVETLHKRCPDTGFIAITENGDYAKASYNGITSNDLTLEELVKVLKKPDKKLKT